MDKSTLNYTVDMSMLAATVICFTTGIIKLPRLLPALGISYASLPMSSISRAHDISGVLIGIAAVMHIVLHWNWLVCMTKNLFHRSKK